ncbi:M90 family metallopeptidase [Pseudoalteromonas tunicata]|jgi:Mlc titration factor MtfA (ptsG expression regulator)|nr:M90 family metallopeptidase [Pseudoalteromonas tunicata]AXT30065.1 zinc-dependent peptidase [Pseudoalteromonas tunicata]
MVNIVLMIFLVVFVLGYWRFDDIRRYYWQKKYQDKQLTTQQQHLISKVMPVYRRLSSIQRHKLDRHILWFLDNISFLGRDGLLVSEAMKWVIAADACLLVIEKPWPIYRNVKQILLYPSAYYAGQEARDSAGLVSFHQVIRQGESWPGGTVVLSWHDVLEGNRLPGDGHNLVFHEFAHQLDQETGATTGTPHLPDATAYKNWSRVFSRAFNHLKASMAYQMPHVIHSYGATNEAEFFAVVTETFIEKPADLRQFDSELYHLLCNYYGFDPSCWY